MVEFQLPPMIEIRCPACVELDWPNALLLFRVIGNLSIVAGPKVFIQTKCWHCKSIISWEYGTDNIKIDKLGNHKRKVQTYNPE